MSSEKSLILMRHAKSDWFAGAATDFERPLNERGIKACKTMATFLIKQPTPQKILHSAAVRTTQTSQHICHCTGWHESLLCSSHTLYLCTVNDILNEIATINDDVNSLMVVAHEPTCSQLVYQLSHQWHPYATASVALFRLPISEWSDILCLDANRHHLVQRVSPKDLA